MPHCFKFLLLSLALLLAGCYERAPPSSVDMSSGHFLGIYHYVNGVAQRVDSPNGDGK